MKIILRKLFSPILNIFESGDEAYDYKKSHRTILITLGTLFTGLASFVYYLAKGQDIGYLIPVLVFGSVGSISLLIGFIGTDRAVAKIWGSKSR
ncbi:hypothetical protein MNBD_GAMMA07-1676 [hydrothermal vent metagenome]|uniref:Uncharacterized protein n=1 Tax=hydrothermal vent metagenome TaxID=652676 RepID=A0A3B0WED9_9ZZZZ